MSDIDFSGLAHSLLFRVRELCAEWLPGGKVIGNEYTCANINGGEGSSFKVNLNTGKWADFAAGSKGGDLISLYAAIKGCSQIEAAKSLQGYTTNTHTSSRQSKVQPNTERLGIPPIGSAKPFFDHHKHGKPSQIWTYRDQEGTELFYIARYNISATEKEFCPFSWSTTSKKWVKKAWPRPRPLYGLELLKSDPTKNILLVEGEKAADAARTVLSKGYHVLSWAGGSMAVDMADLTPLYGRKILLWPDADKKTYPMDHNIGRDRMGVMKPEHEQPGYIAMAKIADKLVAHCPEVKLLSVHDMEKPDGWDAFDAVKEGMTKNSFIEWAKPRVKLWPKPSKAVTAEVVPEYMQGVPLQTEADMTVDMNITISEAMPEVSLSLQDQWSEMGLALTRNQKGEVSPVMNFLNAVKILENSPIFKGHLWYDEFYNDIMTTWNGPKRTWSERDTLFLLQSIQQDFGLIRMSEKHVELAIRTVAFRRITNEPKEWLESLTWDGVKRVENFCRDYMGCSTEPDNYLKAISENFWTAIATRVYSPGCKFDNMVIFEGLQGKGKSTSLSIIGGDWYVDTHIDSRNKDFFQIIQGAIVVEVGEMIAFNKTDVADIKQVLSRTHDVYRAPYARRPEKVPRRCVFVGTTNDDSYLRDATGARRFWPVTTGEISLDKIRQDREQLFAEAVWRHKNGFPIWQVPLEEAKAAQDARFDEDPWTNIVTTFLSGIHTIKLESILTDCLEIDKAHIDARSANRVRSILKKCGYKSMPVREAMHVYKAWVHEHKEGMNYEVKKALGTTANFSSLLGTSSGYKGYNGYKKDE